MSRLTCQAVAVFIVVGSLPYLTDHFGFQRYLTVGLVNEGGQLAAGQ